MPVSFDSQKVFYRTPFGAVEQDTAVHFRILVPKSEHSKIIELCVKYDYDYNWEYIKLIWCGKFDEYTEIWEGSFTPDRIVYPYNQSHAPSLERFVHPSKELSGIRFAEESHTMYLGEQYNPELIFSPDDAGYFDLNWTTNNPSIIKLSGESIWAVGTGYAIVTASTKDNVLSASILINVAVHHVDTSAEPPDVSGKMKEDNSRITDDYKPLNDNLIYLTINGEKGSVNESVKPLLKNLGNRYYQRQPSQSCAYDGLDRFFTYSSDNGG